MKLGQILLVEDEEHLQKAIQLNLELEGYNVMAASSGTEAISKFNSASFNLIILDVMLPGMSGFEVCETIRKTDKKTPILFLTAKDSSTDKIQGLKLGADDYLTKPFNLEEFLLRVHILIKRTAPAGETTKVTEYTFGKNRINFNTFEITTYDSTISELSKREIELLKLLIERKGEVVSREEILDKVWGKDVYPSSRTIDNYILAFRKYFELNQKEPQHFHSIRGVGYKFTE
jgi:two-component system alkaline phosphatase synthesis response regulator PhoP